MNAVMKFMKDEEGATAIEYGLIAGLIAVAIVVVLGTLGTQLNQIFTQVSGKLKDAGFTGTGGGDGDDVEGAT